MRTQSSLPVVLCVAMATAWWCGCGGAAAANDPDYLPTDHPCQTNDDCDDGQRCGEIGHGTEMSPPPEPSPEPPQRYCLRENTDDCCPP